MARTCKSISGLTYGNFDAALSQLGYVRVEQLDSVENRYLPKPKALLVCNDYPLDAEVRRIDLLTTRAVLDGFGIIAPTDFDLLLVQVSEEKVPLLACSREVL